jgi:hypothetical protein
VGIEPENSLRQGPAIAVSDFNGFLCSCMETSDSKEFTDRPPECRERCRATPADDFHRHA